MFFGFYAYTKFTPSRIRFVYPLFLYISSPRHFIQPISAQTTQLSTQVKSGQPPAMAITTNIFLLHYKSDIFYSLQLNIPINVF